MTVQFTDVMIDIETLSLKTDAAIVQIGLCPFNLKEGKISLEPLTIDIDPSEQASYSPSTIIWWMQQSNEAKESVFGDKPRVDELAALKQMEEYIMAMCTIKPNIWAMPPKFDITAIESMYARNGRTQSWRHNKTRCLRTLQELAGAENGDRIQPTIPHNAGYDAEAQAHTAVKFYQMLTHPMTI